MQMTSDAAPDLATLDEMKAATGISASSWWYRRTSLGTLPGLRKLGRHVRISRREFFAALERGEVQ